MDLNDKDELGRVRDRVCNALGVTVDRPLLEEYLAGEDKALISYEKVEQSSTPMPAIQKYLFGAEAYRRQPSLDHYYDIFRSARIVPLLFILDQAITAITGRVEFADERLARLAREMTMDAFDAAMFEVVTAARYIRNPAVKSVAFVEETTQQQPDLRITTDTAILYAECKRFVRSLDATIEIRNAAVKKARIILGALQHFSLSAIVELTFKINPSDVPDEEIARAAGVAVQRGTVETDNLVVSHRPLPLAALERPALFPSSMYFADRYGFFTDGEWHGLLPAMNAKFLGPSYIGDVKWEAAIKWKVSDSKLIWRQKRLGYDLLFKGLDQLAAPRDATDTVLHVCFERDSPLGPRQNELLHFLETLRKQTKHTFGWTIFNELVINVSPTGRFDLVENAHILTGPQRTIEQPLVTNVFVPDSTIRPGIGEFGVGVRLPPVDEDSQASSTGGIDRNGSK